MEVMDLIRERRSIRSYDGRVVETEQLKKVLEAGRLAPSARNMQEWKFVVVQGARLAALCEACSGQRMVQEAGTALVICAAENHMMGCGQPSGTIDCSIALSFMLLQAQELGLGMCWLGAFDADAVKRALDLPQEWMPVAVSPLGYPAEQPAARPRKALEEITLFLKD